MSRYSEGDAPGERTALLSNGHDQDGGHSNGRGVPWKHFFLNSRSTPGTDHSSALVRYSASTWHITKVTLLSSESPCAVIFAVRCTC